MDGFNALSGARSSLIASWQVEELAPAPGTARVGASAEIPVTRTSSSYEAALQRQQRRDHAAEMIRGTPWRVRLDLLGGLEAASRVPGKVDLSGPKPLALLTFLHLAGHTAHKSRDLVAALFWPDLDQNRGRRALRKAVYQLREWCGEDVVVSVGKHQLALIPGVVRSDVLLFRGLWRNRRWEAALDLYRGEFLDGIHVPHASRELDEWIEEERTELRHEAARCALHLAEAAAEAQDYRSAVDWARYALVLCRHAPDILEDFLRFCASVSRVDLAWRVYENHVLWLRAHDLPGPSVSTRILFREAFPDIVGPELDPPDGRRG